MIVLAHERMKPGMTREERLAFKSARRISRQQQECAALLPHVRDIHSIIQVGLGHWREGAELMARFPHANFYAIEPIDRYIQAAKDRGYPGLITRGVALEKSGETISMKEDREKTSVFVGGGRKQITVKIFAVDDILIGETLGSVFLWLDCEGAELQALKGAEETVKKSNYILCEVNQYCASKGYVQEKDIVPWVESRGFNQIAKFRSMALFERTDL